MQISSLLPAVFQLRINYNLSYFEKPRRTEISISNNLFYSKIYFSFFNMALFGNPR